MEEFDLDLNDDMSTPISQLKNKSNLEKNNKTTYSDITDDPTNIETNGAIPILKKN